MIVAVLDHGLFKSLAKFMSAAGEWLVRVCAPSVPDCMDGPTGGDCFCQGVSFLSPISTRGGDGCRLGSWHRAMGPEGCIYV
jgi:hypothetical protein